MIILSIKKTYQVAKALACSKNYFFPILPTFCLFFLFVPFPPLYLDQTFPKSYPNLSVWLSLAQHGSAWHSLAQLGFCFTWFLSGIFSPNLASFSPKPFGHVFNLSLFTIYLTSFDFDTLEKGMAVMVCAFFS